MYGETHVEPGRLFDPAAGQAPPADALDVYFTVPLSLSLVGDAFAHNQMHRELDQLRDLYVPLGRQLVTTMQRQGGYVAGGFNGRAIAARLELAALAHDTVPGVSTMRLHSHVYVGRTAVALETGERHPVALDRLARAADFAWGNYLTQLIDETVRVFGFVWEALPGHHAGDQEIVDPPMADHITGHELGICPGDFGMREQIMADAQWRAGMREAELRLAAERARGIG